MKIASLEDLAEMVADVQIYGECFCDAQGKRVDPREVIVAPDGTSALDSGLRVYKPDRFVESDE